MKRRSRLCVPGEWREQRVVDDYVGYKKTLSLDGVTEIGCMAHAPRKFFDLHGASQSALAAQALDYIGELYAIEREGKLLHTKQTRSEPLQPTDTGYG